METPINKKEERECYVCNKVKPLMEVVRLVSVTNGSYQICDICAKGIWRHRFQTDEKSPIQGSSLNTQKSLGVSEPSLVQEKVDSRCGAPTTYEQQIASLKAEMQDLKDMGLLLSKENVRLQKEVSLSEDRVKKMSGLFQSLIDFVNDHCEYDTSEHKKVLLESQSLTKEEERK